MTAMSWKEKTNDLTRNKARQYLFLHNIAHPGGITYKAQGAQLCKSIRLSNYLLT